MPPLLIAEVDRIDPAKNPFFEHGEAQLFLAYSESGSREPVGRIAAIDDSRHNEIHGETGWLGFFEAADQHVALALLRAAEKWVVDRGRDRIRGPANPSLNDTAGLQLDNFGTDPFVMTPYNRPEYPEWFEAAGYSKLKDLLSWNVDLTAEFSERVLRIERRILRNVTPPPQLRSLDMRRFSVEVEAIRTIYSAAWSDNWGFVAPTGAEFAHAAKDLKQVLDPELALMMDIDGRPAAFSLSLGDLNQVFKPMNGRLLPFGIFRLLRRRRYMDRVRMLLLGVLPEFRKKGLELLLITESWRRARALGYTLGECSWTLEENEGISKAVRIIGGEHTKTYRLYEKRLR